MSTLGGLTRRQYFDNLSQHRADLALDSPAADWLLLYLRLQDVTSECTRANGRQGAG